MLKRSGTSQRWVERASSYDVIFGVELIGQIMPDDADP
jgi:hypothetical protein